MKDTTKRIRAEIRKINKLLTESNVSEQRKKVLTGLIENVAFMRVKLEDARETILESELTIEYDNGGGQTGVRENPLVKSYESLFKTDLSGMSKILDALSSEAAAEQIEEAKKPQTVLELVRGSKKA